MPYLKSVIPLTVITLIAGCSGGSSSGTTAEVQFERMNAPMSRGGGRDDGSNSSSGSGNPSSPSSQASAPLPAFCKATNEKNQPYYIMPPNKVMFYCNNDPTKELWGVVGRAETPQALSNFAHGFCQSSVGGPAVILDLNNSACGRVSSNSTQGGYSSADWNRLWELNAVAAPLKGRTKRWPSRSNQVSGPVSQAQKSAAAKWSGFSFSYGPNGRIIYFGYEHPGNGQDPRLAGWAIPVWRSNGQMDACGIWLSSIHPAMRNPDDAAVIFEHEIGHCLGILGHLRDGGIMEPGDHRSAVHTRTTNQLMSLLYSLPPGTRVSPRGRLSRSELSRDEENITDSDYDPAGSRVYQGPTIYFYHDPQ